MARTLELVTDPPIPLAPPNSRVVALQPITTRRLPSFNPRPSLDEVVANCGTAILKLNFSNPRPLGRVMALLDRS
jgi:hypothetical protein